MPEMIDKYGPIATTDESYQDGLETGRNWRWPHTPGGPFVLTYVGSANNDSNWIAYCNRSKKNNQEWMRGWHDGRNQK